jgi:hypothetical protein
MEDKIKVELPIELVKKVLRILIKYQDIKTLQHPIHSPLIRPSNFKVWLLIVKDILLLDHQVLLLLQLHQQLLLQILEIKMEELEFLDTKRIFYLLMYTVELDKLIFLKVTLTTLVFQKVNSVISIQTDLNMEDFKI